MRSAMQLCHLAFFEKPDDPSARISPEEIGRLRICLTRMAGLTKAHLYTPASASDAYGSDGPPPLFGMQLYFEAIEALETAIGAASELKALVTSGELPGLEGAKASQQAMLCRQFPVPEPKPAAATACSYVVHYPGPARNLNEWHSHYIAHHPRLMAKFSGIREIEILSRIDWIDAMPWPRVDHIQRNRILFDSAEALTAALNSPVRHEMRADFENFPPYSGGNFHYPMLTEIVRTA